VAPAALPGPDSVQVAGIGNVPLAPLSRRFLGRVLGAPLVWAIYMVFIIQFSTGDGNLLVNLIILGLFSIAYEILMVAIFGRTLGKMAEGARIVLAVGGGNPTFGAAVVRWLVPGLAALLPLIGPLGSGSVLLSPVFDSSGRRQGWHDKIAPPSRPRSGAPWPLGQPEGVTRQRLIPVRKPGLWLRI
jgi:hypothetical protein